VRRFHLRWDKATEAAHLLESSAIGSYRWLGGPSLSGSEMATVTVTQWGFFARVRFYNPFRDLFASSFIFKLNFSPDIILVEEFGGREIEEPMATPSRATFLFYLFLNPKDCDALVGDLEERYKLIFKKFSKGKADFWYWSQAIRSTVPIAWPWLKKLVLKPVAWFSGWLVAHGLLNDGSLLEFVKNMLAEWTKRVRG
jgi:hypothetical protein